MGSHADARYCGDGRLLLDTEAFEWGITVTFRFDLDKKNPSAIKARI